MKKLLSALFILFLSSVAIAYIPPFWMIASRVADNHGQSFYQLDMDVVFNHESEPKVINERWFVLDEDNMRLEVRSKKGFEKSFAATFIYSRSNKSFMNEAGQLKRASFGNYFFERLFHVRNDKDLKLELIQKGVISKETLKSVPRTFEPKSLKKDEDSVPSPQIKSTEYVKLDRMEGQVSYKISNGSEADDPGIWIEQDQFVIQKIQFKKQYSVSANDYTSHAGLEFPQNREVRWPDAKAFIRLNSVQAISKSSKNKALVSTSSLKGSQSSLPEDDVIKAFYSQFR